MRFKFFTLLLTILCLFSGFVPAENPFFHEGISLETPEDWKIKESGYTGENWPFVVLTRKELENNGTVTIKWTTQNLNLDNLMDRYTNEMEYKFSQNPETFSYKITEGVFQSKRALKAKYRFVDLTIPYEGTIYCFHFCGRTFLYTEQQSVEKPSNNSEGFYTISSSLSCVEESEE